MTPPSLQWREKSFDVTSLGPKIFNADALHASVTISLKILLRITAGRITRKSVFIRDLCATVSQILHWMYTPFLCYYNCFSVNGYGALPVVGTDKGVCSRLYTPSEWREKVGPHVVLGHLEEAVEKVTDLSLQNFSLSACWLHVEWVMY